MRSASASSWSISSTTGWSARQAPQARVQRLRARPGTRRACAAEVTCRGMASALSASSATPRPARSLAQPGEDGRLPCARRPQDDHAAPGTLGQDTCSARTWRPQGRLNHRPPVVVGPVQQQRRGGPERDSAAWPPHRRVQPGTLQWSGAAPSGQSEQFRGHAPSRRPWPGRTCASVDLLHLPRRPAAGSAPSSRKCCSMTSGWSPMKCFGGPPTPGPAPRTGRCDRCSSEMRRASASISSALRAAGGERPGGELAARTSGPSSPPRGAPSFVTRRPLQSAHPCALHCTPTHRPSGRRPHTSTPCCASPRSGHSSAPPRSPTPR